MVEGVEGEVPEDEAGGAVEDDLDVVFQNEDAMDGSREYGPKPEMGVV